jgi:hypothetical protein
MSGFPARVPATGGATDGGGRQARAAYVDRAYSLRSERFKDDGRTKVLILGNSFARDFLNMIVENDYMRGCELSYEPVLEISAFSCIRDFEKLTPGLRARILACDVLVLVMPIFDVTCVREDIAWLRSQGVRQVLVIGTKNFGWNPNAILRMSDADARQFRAAVLKEVVDANAVARSSVPDGSFVDVLELTMDSDGRVPLLTPDGELISEDGGHLTRAGARFIGKRVFEHPLLAPYR